MIEDRTLAHINVTPATGQLTIFTEAGVMLSRAIGGKKAGMVLDEGEDPGVRPPAGRDMASPSRSLARGPHAVGALPIPADVGHGPAGR